MITLPCGCPSRRTFFRSLAALGAASALPGCGPQLQSANAGRPHRIDVHHHLTPPPYLSALKMKKLGEPPTFGWTVERSLADMDSAGVATSILSITTPGVYIGDNAESRQIARACNEYAAKLTGDHPGRFGSFAAVPLPDVDGSLREIEYALDTLKADGVCLMTSAGNNQWLGDAAFAPVMQELNRRRAVVYTHPTIANCCRNLIAEVPGSAIEFATDTTRTIASILFTGTAVRFPDIRWIFSHAGGTMPFITERFTRLPNANPKAAANVPNGVLPELRKFHYDIAQAAHPMALSALLKLIPVSQVMYGTDYPFRTSIDHVKGLLEHGFSAADLAAIDRDRKSVV